MRGGGRGCARQAVCAAWGHAAYNIERLPTEGAELARLRELGKAQKLA